MNDTSSPPPSASPSPPPKARAVRQDDTSTKATLSTTANKHSYTVPCSSGFRDAVTDLADSKRCNVADLARSVVLMVPLDVIDAHPDPGGPGRDDRETIILKSGKSKGKPWRRKPRLQVRMVPGFEVATIRKALSMALEMDKGALAIAIDNPEQVAAAKARDGVLAARLHESEQEVSRLRGVVQSLHFEPLANGVHSRDQALYVLGFPPGAIPEVSAVRTRFRKLATVYHPDGKNGCHQRMSQLNAAMELLRRGGM